MLPPVDGRPLGLGPSTSRLPVLAFAREVPRSNKWLGASKKFKTEPKSTQEPARRWQTGGRNRRQKQTVFLPPFCHFRGASEMARGSLGPSKELKKEPKSSQEPARTCRWQKLGSNDISFFCNLSTSSPRRPWAPKEIEKGTKVDPGASTEVSERLQKLG